MRNFILSPVGTSFLTNPPISPSEREVVKNTANKTEEELTPEERAVIDNRLLYLRESMIEGNLQVWADQSAEINGVLSYAQSNAMDYHVLLASDTYQCRQIAAIVEDFIRTRLKCSTQMYVPARLSTKSRECFSSAMVQVAKWCEDTIPGYKASGYRIIFNLTGGFKSVQGFLNTLGTLYADQIIYIFEPPNKELITIPRLPIKLDADDIVSLHASVLALLDGQSVPTGLIDISRVPEFMYETINIDGTEYVSLNVWGTVVWQRGKKQVFGGVLLDWPCLEYEQSFKKDFEDIKDVNQRVAVQNALSRASFLLLTENGDIAPLRRDGGLLYEDFVNKGGIGHFRVNDFIRISCTSSGGGLSLRHVGAHDYVNVRP